MSREILVCLNVVIFFELHGSSVYVEPVLPSDSVPEFMRKLHSRLTDDKKMHEKGFVL